ncbi:MAG: ABC transporter substrate-binding protein [Actinomycetales bacterium]|jgi:multiple sugar transport system substrate-binding protein|nr:sugar ABC transporter substrate-binding protein [Leifsonia sp.]
MKTRKGIRRGILATIAMAAALPLVAGCTAGTSSSTPANTTLTVMTGAQDLSKDQIAEFQKQNPGITVKVIATDTTRLNTMLAAGNPPDIAIGAAIGSANINARGLATDLTPYLAKSKVLKESDLQPVNNGFRWNGKQSGKGDIYGIVKDWSQDNTLWYNTALFDKAQVPYLSATKATTYDQLLDISKKLSSADGKQYGLGLEWAWSLYAPISAMVLQQGGHLFNSDLTKVDFDSTEAKRALQWYVDFGQANVGPTSLNPLADGSDYSTFAANRMAITQDGYWFGGNFADPKAMKTVAMAPAPVMGDKPVATTYSGQGWWIPAKAKNKDAAWKLIEYYMAGKPAQDRASSGWGIPALKSLMSKMPQTTPYQKQAYQVAKDELAHAEPLPDSPYVTTDLLNTTIDKYLQQAIKKQLTVDQAATAITNDVNKALKQGKEQIG